MAEAIDELLARRRTLGRRHTGQLLRRAALALAGQLAGAVAAEAP